MGKVIAPNPLPIDLFWNFRRREPNELNTLKAARAAYFWTAQQRTGTASMIRRGMGWLDRVPRDIVKNTWAFGPEARSVYGRSISGQISDQWRLYRSTGAPSEYYYHAGGPGMSEQDWSRLISFNLYESVIGFCTDSAALHDGHLRIGLKSEFHAAARKYSLHCAETLATLNPDEAVDDDLANQLLSSFFLKPDNGSSGSDAERWRRVGGEFELASSDKRIPKDLMPDYLRARATKLGRRMIVQRLVENSSAIQLWAGPALSTMRIDTIKPSDAAPFVSRVAYRVPGSMTSSVDNFHQGGAAFPMDVETGILGLGADQVPGGQRHALTHSPATGARVAGEELPGWAAACELACRLHENLTGVISVGWDLGLTDDGPVAIEANFPPGLDGICQYWFDGFLGSTICATLVAEIKLKLAATLPPESRFQVGADWRGPTS